MHDGSTVEVMNTDAEGRLTMADALSHAQSYDPELVVDLATLTGSSVVALGHEAAAFMTPEGDEANELLDRSRSAAGASGDRLHPLPLYDAYADRLDSDVADCKNVGGKPADHRR
jgi:leucyl aminopeptidase